MTLTEEKAQRLTQRIQLRLSTIADNVDAVVPLIEEARAGDAHEALGYRSWTEYVSEKFGGTLTRLGKSERTPIVALLSDQGMSTRAIASVVGVSKDTVSRDLRTGVSDETPDGVSNGEAHSTFMDATEGEFEAAIREARAEGDLSRENVKAEVVSTRARTVTGIDGKTYSKSEPRKPRRSPLPDSYWRAMYDLEKSVERLERLHRDDRFEANRDGLQHETTRLADLATRLGHLGRDLNGREV